MKYTNYNKINNRMNHIIKNTFLVFFISTMSMRCTAHLKKCKMENDSQELKQNQGQMEMEEQEQKQKFLNSCRIIAYHNTNEINKIKNEINKIKKDLFLLKEQQQQQQNTSWSFYFKRIWDGTQSLLFTVQMCWMMYYTYRGPSAQNNPNHILNYLDNASFYFYGGNCTYSDSCVCSDTLRLPLH